MRDTLRTGLTRAITSRDSVAVAALRSALDAMDTAESVDVAAPGVVPDVTQAAVAGSVAGPGAADVPRRELTDADVEWIVRAEVTERLAAAGDYQRLRYDADAERLRAEARVLAGYLPPTT